MLICCSSVWPSWNCPANGPPSGFIPGASVVPIPCRMGVAATAATGGIGVAAEPAGAAVVVGVVTAVAGVVGTAEAHHWPGGHGLFGSIVGSGVDEHASAPSAARE